MAKKTETNQNQTADKAQANELYVISDYLKSLKFAPRIMGVDEADVWKKIEKLCELYDDALTAERGKSEKLARQLKVCAAKLKELLPEKKEQ